jgi:cyclophilin family peptidyl-prolyl cis-trans isomerase
MKQKIHAVISNHENIIIELGDSSSPKTVSEFIRFLPFSVNTHLCGDEIYTDEYQYLKTKKMYMQ